MEPDTPKPKIQIDCAYNLVVTVDFHADLTKPETVNIPLELPLHGEWLISGYEQDSKPALHLGYGAMSVGRLGADTTIRYSLFWLQGGTTRRIDAYTWANDPLPDKTITGVPHKRHDMGLVPLEAAAAASDGQFDPSTHRAYRLCLSIDSLAPVASHQTPEKLELASRLSQLGLEHIPHTLRLVFSRLNGSDAELWASGQLLSSKLPYFKDLLASDFEEATVRRSKRARKSGAHPVDVADEQKSFGDSDDETDDVLFTVRPPTSIDSPESADVPFHEISIKHTAFSTYHALLVYLQTGFVHFAPLKSASSPSNPSSSSTRRDYLSDAYDDKASLPLPVSPKSLYRLIDLLRLPDSDPLHTLCLRAFADSLTHDGAAHELFSEASICFDKLRAVVLEYILANHDAVTTTTSWNAVLAEIRGGERPDAAPVLVELLQAVQARLQPQKKA
ncbi:hypothetical protein JCM10207_003893 [Rhodosporidiobolus poonsookiae]